MIPLDPLRQAPLSFSEWCETFLLDPSTAPDELEQIRATALTLLKNPLVRRIMAQMEANAMRHLADCPLGDEQEAHRRLMLLSAARSLPKALQAFVDDLAFETKQKKLKT